MAVQRGLYTDSTLRVMPDNGDLGSYMWSLVVLVSQFDTADERRPVRYPKVRSSVRRTMDRKAHWERVYTTKGTDAVSWFQPAPTVSTQLLNAAGLTTYT
jgi:hypothetical protein